MEMILKTFLSEDRIMVTPEFISKNKLSLKSPNEIYDKFIEIHYESKTVDFRIEVIAHYVQYNLLEAYLRLDSAKNLKYINSVEEAAQDFLDYMNFAWGKAQNKRGLSAARSIEKLAMWLWLLNREDLAAIIKHESLYEPYGAPALIKICDILEIDIPNSLVEFVDNNLKREQTT